jgi:hypothetical protein
MPKVQMKTSQEKIFPILIDKNEEIVLYSQSRMQNGRSNQISPNLQPLALSKKDKQLSG